MRDRNTNATHSDAAQTHTYPGMNETIKDMLRRSGEPMQLCALARIEELEKTLIDAETQHRVEYCEDAKYDCVALKNCRIESKEKILSIRDEISQRFHDMLCVEKYKSSTFSDTWTAAVSFPYSMVQKVFMDSGYWKDT